MSVATLANPDLDDDARLDGIEPAAAHTREEGDFVVYEDVPVWKEHTNRDGVYFGKQQLERVCKNLNERITETGDFSPIVIGHTDDDRRTDPPVVGFSGPYRLSRIGSKDPKWCIVARKFRIFKRDYQRSQRYPRLSVEYWASKKDPTNGHFDPICLLGAETPELDLGLRYAKRDDAAECVRYSRFEHNPTHEPVRYGATAPSGANTFVPSDDSPQRYEQGGDNPSEPEESTSMALSQDDIAQIVEAMKPVMQAMIEENAAGGLGDPDDLGAGDGAEAAPPDAAAPPTAPPGLPPEAPPPAGPVDKDDEPAKRYRRERDDYHQKYQREVAARREAESKLAEVSQKVAVAQGDARKAQRYAKLQELKSDGYSFDLDEELTDTEALDDDRFSRHCDKIVQRYERIPIGRRIPLEAALPMPTKSDPQYETRERYARQAREETERRRTAGQEVEYFDVLDEITKTAASKNGQPAATS